MSKLLEGSIHKLLLLFLVLTILGCDTLFSKFNIGGDYVAPPLKNFTPTTETENLVFFHKNLS